MRFFCRPLTTFGVVSQFLATSSLANFRVADGGTGDQWLSFAPNGDLYVVAGAGHTLADAGIVVIKSGDGGLHWSAPLMVAGSFKFVLDPTNRPSPWMDGRFSSFQYPDTAFAMSADGGLTWSVPIRVNRTPLDIAPANRQAFFSSIAVSADGTIGVSYYDFRFNDANPGLPTDRWLVLCHPSSAKPATNAANWGSEVRLTDSSFNMEAVVAGKDRSETPRPAVFIGDYFGLAAAGNDFVSVFIQPDHDNVTSAFFRRVKP